MKRAFTLLEVLIVVAVITIIATILLAILGSAKPRYSGKRQSCSAKLREIGRAFVQYGQDYNDYFPPARVTPSRGWADVLSEYTHSNFHCPSDEDLPAKFSTDYFYNRRLARLQFEAIRDPALTIVAGDGEEDALPWNSWAALPSDAATNTSSPSQRHSGGATYGFVDGHVKWYKPTDISSTYAAPTSRPTFAFQ